MKRPLLPILTVILLVVFCSRDPVLIQINNRPVTEQSTKMHQQVGALINNIDKFNYSQALLEQTKNHIFTQFCLMNSIEITHQYLTTIEENLKSQLGIPVLDSIKEIMGSKYTEYFLKPYAAHVLLIEHIMSDTLLYQEEPYRKASMIFDQWNNDKSWEVLLDNRSEYFRKSIDRNTNDDYFKSNEFNRLTDDMSYYYVYRLDNDLIEGIRVKKIPADSIIISMRDSIDIVFFNESALRSLRAVTDGTFWHQIIFNE